VSLVYCRPASPNRTFRLLAQGLVSLPASRPQAPFSSIRRWHNHRASPGIHCDQWRHIALAVTNIVINDTDNFDVHDMNCRAQSPLRLEQRVSSMRLSPVDYEGGTAELITGQLQLFTSDPAFTGLITVSGQALLPAHVSTVTATASATTGRATESMSTSRDRWTSLSTCRRWALTPNTKIFFCISTTWQTTRSGGIAFRQAKTGCNGRLQATSPPPVKNPDLKPGIQLHIDCGSDCIMNPVTGALWEWHPRPQRWLRQLPWTPWTLQAVSSPLDGRSSTRFPPHSCDRRSLAFHHVIFAHNLWTNNSTSGISRNGADVTTGASDLVVALGSWPTPAEPPSNRQVRSTTNSGTTWGCCTADATPSIESQTI